MINKGIYKKIWLKEFCISNICVFFRAIVGKAKLNLWYNKLSVFFSWIVRKLDFSNHRKYKEAWINVSSKYHNIKKQKKLY